MKIKSVVKLVQSRIPLVAFSLAALSPGALAQDRLGNGGEISNRVLRDLIDHTVCHWVTGDQMKNTVQPNLDLVLGKLKDSLIREGSINQTLTTLFVELNNQIHTMIWCQTEAPLVRVDTQDENTVITSYEGKTTQLAVRVDSKVFLDMNQFRRMDKQSQAMLLIHEAMHGIVTANELGHNGQVRSLVKSIDSYSRGTISRNTLIDQARLNGVIDTSPVKAVAGLARAGFSMRALLNSGYALADLKLGGIPAERLWADGVSASELAQLTRYYSTRELLDGGYDPKDLKVGGFTARDFFANNQSQDRVTVREGKQAGFSIIEMISYRSTPPFTYSEINEEFSRSEIKKALTWQQFEAIDGTSAEALKLGYRPTEFCQLTQDYTRLCRSYLRAVGIIQARLAGISASIFFENYRYERFEDQLNPIDYLNAGYSKREILEAMATSDRPFLPSLMKDAGFTASDLRNTGNWRYLHLPRMIGSGFSKRELIKAGYSKSEYRAIMQCWSCYATDFY